LSSTSVRLKSNRHRKWRRAEGARKLRALHAAAGRLIHQSPPKAAPYSRQADEWIKRARTSPPRGASRPRFLRATGPPRGLLPAVMPMPKARSGPPLGAGLWRGFGGLLAGLGGPVEAPRAGPGEVDLAVSRAGLRSLPAQQQAPKALPYGQQFQHAWSCRRAGIARADRGPGGDDPPVTRYKARWHGRIVTAERRRDDPLVTRWGGQRGG